MVGNAIAQSSQPIISHNYGIGQMDRDRATFRLSVRVGLLLGALLTLGGLLFSDKLALVFISSDTEAYRIAAEGLPYFSLAYVLFTLNLIFIGYHQSLEEFQRATLYMSLRGFLLVIPSFILLPLLLQVPGLWLAVPLSELLTLGGIVIVKKLRS